AALLNIKSTLGVTYTTWTATSPCRLFGSLVGFPGEWEGLWCNGDGKALLFAVDGLGLKGSIHAEMSALTTLTRPLSPPFPHLTCALCTPPLPSARPLCPLHAPLCLLLAPFALCSLPLFLLLAPFALCSPLPRRSLTSNFFNYRIDSFTSSMKALPNLVDM
ncbi:unnamed protein product, partial [Closterium sp. NIES-64]